MRRSESRTSEALFRSNQIARGHAKERRTVVNKMAAMTKRLGNPAKTTATNIHKVAKRPRKIELKESWRRKCPLWARSAARVHPERRRRIPAARTFQVREEEKDAVEADIKEDWSPLGEGSITFCHGICSEPKRGRPGSFHISVHRKVIDWGNLGKSSECGFDGV
jgi:hypothetical protein